MFLQNFMEFKEYDLNFCTFCGPETIVEKYD
jgi:hypothetical protein